VLLSFLNKPFNPFNGLRVGRKPANDRLASSKLFSYSNAPIVPLADSLFVKICTVDLFDSGHTGLNGDIKPDPKASVNS